MKSHVTRLSGPEPSCTLYIDIFAENQFFIILNRFGPNPKSQFVWSQFGWIYFSNIENIQFEICSKLLTFSGRPTATSASPTTTTTAPNSASATPTKARNSYAFKFFPEKRYSGPRIIRRGFCGSPAKASGE